jgi:hypothetical protein
MLRPLAVLALLLALVLAACGGDDDGGGTSATPSASPTTAPTATPLASGDAVYISIGDATQEGWGDDFADYLSDRLNREVQHVAFTGDVTTTELIAGVAGQKPSLLDRAIAAIDDYESQGAVVVAVTLGAGSKDIADLSASCSDCGADAAALLQRYHEQVGVIYARLVQSLDGPAPILQAIAFDAAACSTPDTSSPVEAAPLNAAAAEIAADNDAIVVDIPWSPALCGLTGRLTAGAAARILEAHQAAYDALPSERVEPFVAP